MLHVNEHADARKGLLSSVTLHNIGSSDSSALCYELDDKGFESRQGIGISLFTTVSRPALGSIQPPIQWVPGAISLGVKRPGREADHSASSSAEVKNAWGYTSSPPKPIGGVVLS
jgi:hypothetical protein